MTAFRTEFVHAPRPLPPARISCENANALKKECPSLATTGEHHACPSLRPGSVTDPQGEAPREMRDDAAPAIAVLYAAFCPRYRLRHGYAPAAAPYAGRAAR